MFSKVRSLYESFGVPVLQPELHPSASIEYRSRQLKAAIEEAYGLGHPVHIIGHSMGGLDARYLASPAGLGCGDRICTIVTLGTPHKGSPVARRIPRSLTWTVGRIGRMALKGQRIVPGLGRYSRYWEDLADDRWEALEELTGEYLNKKFNTAIIDHPAVRYYSYGGDISSGSHKFLSRFRAHIARLLGVFNEPHDGLVAVESTKWGTFLGVLPADHGAMIGLQVIPGVCSGFDHLPFFEQLMYHLALQER
jgi:triacylglycerol lipase